MEKALQTCQLINDMAFLVFSWKRYSRTMMKYNSNSVRKALSNTVMDPKQRWDASESAGMNPGRHACEAESTYGLHVKECINEWDGPLQRVPKLRGGIRGLGSESFCVSVLAVT